MLIYFIQEVVRLASQVILFKLGSFQSIETAFGWIKYTPHANQKRQKKKKRKEKREILQNK